MSFSTVAYKRDPTLSHKQSVKEFILSKIFGELSSMGSSNKTLLEALDYRRKLDSYIINVFNTNVDYVIVLHSLNPRLFNLVTNHDEENKQNIELYRECTVDDAIVNRVFAFKMLTGE